MREDDLGGGPVPVPVFLLLLVSRHLPQPLSKVSIKHDLRDGLQDLRPSLGVELDLVAVEQVVVQ